MCAEGDDVTYFLYRFCRPPHSDAVLPATITCLLTSLSSLLAAVVVDFICRISAWRHHYEVCWEMRNWARSCVVVQWDALGIDFCVTAWLHIIRVTRIGLLILLDEMRLKLTASPVLNITETDRSFRGTVPVARTFKFHFMLHNFR